MSFQHCELVILILAMALQGQVHAEKIYGGDKAKPHSRPYMVLLERQMENSKTRFCGGFLVSQDFVMTAAHCKAKSYTVLLGLHDYHDSNGVEHIPVEHAYPHENYSATAYENDIMLLKLSSKATLNKKVTYIDLAENDSGTVPTSCSVAGWGKYDRNIVHISHVLREVNVTLKEMCPLETVYCSEGKTGPGEGDSGGPLVCGTEAYGLVAATYVSEESTHTYTKIPAYKEWIKGIMG